MMRIYQTLTEQTTQSVFRANGCVVILHKTSKAMISQETKISIMII
jgi:hypothetical protein